MAEDGGAGMGKQKFLEKLVKETERGLWHVRPAE